MCVVVLVHLFGVTSLKSYILFIVFKVYIFFIKIVAGGVYGTLLCLYSVLVSFPVYLV